MKYIFAAKDECASPRLFNLQLFHLIGGQGESTKDEIEECGSVSFRLAGRFSSDLFLDLKHGAYQS